MPRPEWSDTEVIESSTARARRRRRGLRGPLAAGGAALVTLVAAGLAAAAVGGDPSRLFAPAVGALSGALGAPLAGLGSAKPGAAGPADAEASPVPTPDLQRDVHRDMHRWHFGAPLHGTFVIQTADGYRTVQVQRGEVTEVDASSISLKSADGFTATYAIAESTVIALSGGIESVAPGDSLMVAATDVDGTPTADFVAGGWLGDGRHLFGRHGFGPHGLGPDGQPFPRWNSDPSPATAPSLSADVQRSTLT